MKKANEKYRIVAEWGRGYTNNYSLRYYTERLVTSFFFFKKWQRFGDIKRGYASQASAQREINEIGQVGVVWESP